jgi:hypothetical protein
VAILTILGSVLVYSGRAQDAREIAKRAFPSVVMLLMEDNAGQALSLGSGFIVKKSFVATNLQEGRFADLVDNVVKGVFIATNLHVVAGAAKGYAKFVGQKTKYDILGYVAIDEKSDLVLLKIKDVNAPVLSLGDSNKVSIGDEIFVIGNPQGLEGTFSKGIVSAVRTVGQDSLLQITAPISPGSSGGPVLSEKGEVIGVAVATFKGGQNLNFAIPSSYVSTLLADLKPLKQLASQGKTKTEVKSILSDLGSQNTEGVIGGRFLWDQPLLQWGHYSFSLQNKLRQPVKNVWCLVIFYDGNEEAIDVDVIRHVGLIPAGLAKRVTSMVDNSVQKLTTRKEEGIPHTKLEFRILDFQIVEESEDGL